MVIGSPPKVILFLSLVGQNFSQLKLLHTGTRVNNDFLLAEREGRTGEYWPEVVIVRTSLRLVRTKTTGGQYSSVRLEQARLVSSLLYGTRFSC